MLRKKQAKRMEACKEAWNEMMLPLAPKRWSAMVPMVADELTNHRAGCSSSYLQLVVPEKFCIGGAEEKKIVGPQAPRGPEKRDPYAHHI